MRTKIFLFLAIMAVALSHPLTGQCDTMVQKTYKMKKFNSIEVTQGIQVSYTQGTNESLKVKATQEIYDILLVKWSGSTLVLTFKNDAKSRKIHERLKHQIVKVDVVAPAVTEFNATTGATIRCLNPIKSKSDIDVEVTTGASFTSPGISAAGLDVEATTGGTVSISGVDASKLNVESTTGSNVAITGVDVSETDVEVTTGGVVSVSGKTVKATYSATTSGSAKCGSLKSEKAKGEASTSGVIEYWSKDADFKAQTGGVAVNAR